MIYSIVNPSDPVTIEAEDELLASIAVIILGKGAYGLYDEDEKVIVPIFRFSEPERLVRWLNDRGIDSDKMEEFYAKNAEVLASILESAVYGSVGDRKAILAAVGSDDRIAALARYNDTKRSSMNDIGASAFALAKVFRDKAAQASTSPQTP